MQLSDIIFCIRIGKLQTLAEIIKRYVYLFKLMNELPYFINRNNYVNYLPRKTSPFDIVAQ